MLNHVARTNARPISPVNRSAHVTHQVGQVLDAFNAIAVQLQLGEAVKAKQIVDLGEVTIAEDELVHLVERDFGPLVGHLIRIALGQLHPHHLSPL
jgi:hypothetical protein